MRRYRTTKRCIVRAQPSAFAPELRRLLKGVVFVGYPARDEAWVARILGGYVERVKVVESDGPNER